MQFILWTLLSFIWVASAAAAGTNKTSSGHASGPGPSSCTSGRWETKGKERKIAETPENKDCKQAKACVLVRYRNNDIFTGCSVKGGYCDYFGHLETYKTKMETK